MQRAALNGLVKKTLTLALVTPRGPITSRVLDELIKVVSATKCVELTQRLLFRHDFCLGGRNFRHLGGDRLTTTSPTRPTRFGDGKHTPIFGHFERFVDCLTHESNAEKIGGCEAPTRVT